jgi:hypothetical protein
MRNMHLIKKKKVQHTSVSAGEMKNVTEDDINAFYSRQGAHTHAPTVLHCYRKLVRWLYTMSHKYKLFLATNALFIKT